MSFDEFRVPGLRFLAACLLPALLAACTPADRVGCPAGDLATLGRDEGLAGKPASLPRADCALDEDERTPYLRGRAEGLARYCVAQRGYQLGLEGKPADPKACNGAAAEEFSRGLEVGNNLRTHLARRDELNAQATEAERLAAKLPAGSPERANIEQQAANARFEARAHENDVEALRAIVAVEKWR